MILPFITPSDNEVLNLNQMVRWKAVDEALIQVTFSDGVTRTYSDDAARIVKAEIVFAVNTYRQFQKGIHAAGESPLIVVPDHSNGQIN